MGSSNALKGITVVSETVSPIDRNPDPTFRFIDLFAGIGGCRLGFERAGGECVFTSEWDRFARQTYEANHPADEGSEHVFAGDIREVSASEIPGHDVLVGGFPCQPSQYRRRVEEESFGPCARLRGPDARNVLLRRQSDPRRKSS